MRSLLLLLAVLVASACGRPDSWCTSTSCPSGSVCIQDIGECFVPNGPTTAAPSDGACGEVPYGGRCATGTSIERCIVPSGNAPPRVSVNSCDTGEVCVADSRGASCQLTADCRENDTRCSGTAIEQCSGGRWVAATCSGSCRATAFGAACMPAQTKVVSAHFDFEARLPNKDYSEWDSTPTSYQAGGFLVASFAAGTLLDASTMQTDGTFAVAVRSAPGPDDVVVVMAAAAFDGHIRLMVANPRLAAGEHSPGEHGSQPTVWNWSIPSAKITNGSNWTARLESGSAAAFVFADAYTTYQRRSKQFGRAPDSLVVWLSPEVTWSCGNCFWSERTQVASVAFDTQIVRGGGRDESFWSDSVTGHELGHWVMASYGVSPNEGGKHFESIPTFPGQAWSEGWASYHQADLLNRGFMFDHQNGGLFWVDYVKRDYGDNLEWTRPSASLGLLQRIDENEVTAMLVQLHESSPSAPDALMMALASPRMTGSHFARGYTTHTWAVDSVGAISNVQDTGRSAPCFADYLDALSCNGFSRATIDAATEPSTHFPYPSQSPLCQ